MEIVTSEVSSNTFENYKMLKMITQIKGSVEGFGFIGCIIYL